MLDQEISVSSCAEANKAIEKPQRLQPLVEEELEELEENQEGKYPEGGFDAWRVVLGSFLGLFAGFGLANSLGAIQAYIQRNQLSNLSESKVSWIFSIFSYLAFALSIQIGPLFDLYGPYYLCIAATLLHVVCLIMTSLCTEFYQFLLAFGVGCGISVSLVVTPCLAIISHWFKTKRGTATGFASVGGALGGVLFPIMLRALYEKVGYAWAMRVLALISFVAMASSVLLIKPRPKTYYHMSKGIKLSPKYLYDFKALGDLRFLFLTIAIFLCELSILDGITYITSYCLAQGMPVTTSYLMLTLVNCAGIAGRLGAGIVSDKIGRYNTMTLSIALAFISIFAIWLPVGSKFGPMVGFSLLYGYSTGSQMSLTPVCIGQICHTKDYGKRYGTLYFFSALAMLFGIPISGLLINGNNYNHLVILCGASYLLAFVFIVASRYVCAGPKLLCKV